METHKSFLLVPNVVLGDLLVFPLPRWCVVVMDKDESHEISSEDKDVGRTAGEESPPSTDGESVDGISSSSFAASLREKVSIVRKERAGGVMVRARAVQTTFQVELVVCMLLHQDNACVCLRVCVFPTLLLQPSNYPTYAVLSVAPPYLVRVLASLFFVSIPPTPTCRSF